MHKKDFTLAPIKEGFIRGNVFEELNQPYKHYMGVKPKINSEREADLVRLMATSLYAHDLHLYLDVYPQDQDAFGLFKEYQEATNRLSKEFVEKYGSLTVSNMGDTWDWVAFPKEDEK